MTYLVAQQFLDQNGDCSASSKQATAYVDRKKKLGNSKTLILYLPTLGASEYSLSIKTQASLRGAPTSVPVADATVKNLELLLNTLLKNVSDIQREYLLANLTQDPSERIPYRFTYSQKGERQGDFSWTLPCLLERIENCCDSLWRIDSLLGPFLALFY